MNHIGKLEVICGPAQSGKSSELIARIRRFALVGKEGQAFVHKLNSINQLAMVITHSGDCIPATLVSSPQILFDFVRRVDTVVAVDDAHLFGPQLVDVCLRLSAGGTDVVVAGLETDFGGQPIKHMARLMAYADRLTKLNSVCVRCRGISAFRTQALIDGDVVYPSFYLTAKLTGLTLEPRCRGCFIPPGKEASTEHDKEGANVPEWAN